MENLRVELRTRVTGTRFAFPCVISRVNQPHCGSGGSSVHTTRSKMAKQQEGGKRTVLVAVDGSEHSERAFDWYAKNFYRKDDEILVFHAHELPAMPAAPYPYGFDFSEGFKQHVAESDRKARDLLESYYKRCQEKNLKCRLIKETGHAGEAVCKVAKERGVDHVVMGSRGLGTINRALVGSVSDYCLHHASVPVSVVPPPNRFQQHGYANKH